MLDASTLVLFLVAVLMLQLSPGPNMAFVLSHGATHGPRAALAAGAGIAAADVVHTLCAASGITAVVAAWPPAFDLLRYAGAGYLLWLAFHAIRTPGKLVPGAGTAASAPRIFRRAMINCLLNPKALLFFMVFLPQFVDVRRGPVLPQIVLLGLVLSAAALLFNAFLAYCGGQAQRLLRRVPGAARTQGWLLGGVLLALALRLLLLDRPTR